LKEEGEKMGRERKRKKGVRVIIDVPIARRYAVGGSLGSLIRAFIATSLRPGQR
jgi:hypothetical protein